MLLYNFESWQIGHMTHFNTVPEGELDPQYRLIFHIYRNKDYKS